MSLASRILSAVFFLPRRSVTLPPAVFEQVQNIVLPGSSQMIGGLDVVVLDDAKAHAIIDDANPDAIVAKKNVPPSPSRNQPVG